MLKIYTDSSFNTIESMVRHDWCNQEYWEDALVRAATVAALKLAFWRKYPKISRMRFVQIISGAWYELSALISYERGKYYTHFEKRALRKFGRKEVFMELDYDRLKTL